MEPVRVSNAQKTAGPSPELLDGSSVCPVKTTRTPSVSQAHPAGTCVLLAAMRVEPSAPITV